MVKSDDLRHYRPEKSSHQLLTDNGNCNSFVWPEDEHRYPPASTGGSSSLLSQSTDGWDTTSAVSSRNEDFVDVLKSNADDLTAANLTPITDPIHTSSSSLSSEDDYDYNSERIKLLCGDEDEQEDENFHHHHFSGKHDLKNYSRRHSNSDKLGGAASHHQRRRVFSRLGKVFHKARKKCNWHLALLFTVIFIVFLSMSQLTTYQYRSVGIVGWDLNTTRDTSVYIAPDRHTATLEPRIMEGGKKYLLLVIVCSSVENFTTRQTIRETWANSSEFNYESYFHRMHSHVARGSYEGTNMKVVQRIRRQLRLDEEQEEHQTNANNVGTNPQSSSSHGRDLNDVLATQVIFLVGQPQSNATQQQLVEESTVHGDMLQEDFMDTYYNLTLKSIMLLKWINNLNRDTVRVKYVMKCDDDTFLNLPNLVHVILGGTVPIYKDTFGLFTADNLRRNRQDLSETAFQNDILMGFLFRNAKPIRDIASKWFAPKYMYRKKLYPNYLSGTGYLIEATSTAKKLYSAAMRTPIFHLEDVYITGICASRGGSHTKPHHNPLFSYLPYVKRECALRGMITQHPLTSTDIRRAYERLMNISYHCEFPSPESIERLMNSNGEIVRSYGIMVLIAAVLGSTVFIA